MHIKYSELLNTLNISEFIAYYKNHNIRDTTAHYNTSTALITKLCKEIGFKKDQSTINEQIKQTKINRYGSLSELDTQNRIKQHQTLIDKYGSIEDANRLRVERIKLAKAKDENSFTYKINQINKEEFIDLYINQNKPRTYMMDKYNVSSYILDRVIEYFDCHKPKSQSSSIGLSTKYERYGGRTNYFNHMNSRVRDAKIKHYGSLELAKQDASETYKETWRNKSEDEKLAIIERTRQTNLSKYGFEFYCQSPSCRLKGNSSKPNLEFNDLLLDNSIAFSREFPITNKSFDFKVNDTLIEIDPTATHNSIVGIRDNPPLPINYHKLKSQLARDNGYKCIHVWDWDNKNKIVCSLKDKKVIYARKCAIKEIPKYEVDEFLNLYHFQNTCKNQAVRLGLFCGGQLIQVMTFGKPRYNRKYQFELLRLCTKAEYKVVGGAEKLFKHFIDKYDPESIISYCDLSKFNGDVYYKLGFSLKSEGVPTCHWYNMRTHRHILDSSLRAKGFDILLGKEYGCFGKGASNEQLMLDHNFVKVYDCGQAQFIWLKQLTPHT